MKIENISSEFSKISQSTTARQQKGGANFDNESSTIKAFKLITVRGNHALMMKEIIFKGLGFKRQLQTGNVRSRTTK